METSSSFSDDKTECDSITAVELEKTKRILYFSDGVMEELSESEAEDVGQDITDKSMDININMTDLPLVPRLKYQVYKIGRTFLGGIEYLGEGLASFFGITTPKYVTQSDIENVKNNGEQTQDPDENKYEGSIDWCHNNNNKTNVITIFSRNSENNSS